MENTKTPLTLDGVNKNIYAGFWLRLGAVFMDTLVGWLFWILVLYPLSWDNTYLSFVFEDLLSLLFFLFTSVYLVQLLGASPGKWWMNIKIIKLNGRAIDLKSALLREIVGIVENLLFLLYIFYLWWVIDLSKFESLGDDDIIFADRKQSEYVFSFIGEENALIFSYFLGAWILSELVVLLMNKRKRALHDYIAGTVVIKKEYESAIREEMGLDLDLEEYVV